MAEQRPEFREETASVSLLIKRLGATVGIQANWFGAHTHTYTHTNTQTHTLNLPEWLNLHPRLISPSNVSHSPALVLKASVIRSALISLTEEWGTPQMHLLSAIKLVSIKEWTREEGSMRDGRIDRKRREAKRKEECKNCHMKKKTWWKGRSSAEEISFTVKIKHYAQHNDNYIFISFSFILT